MTIQDYLKLLRDTPLPTILVIGGIIFLLLSILQKAGTSIATRPGSEKFSIFIGIVLLLAGVGLYLVPPTQQVATSTIVARQDDLPPTPSPIFTKPSNVEPTFTPELPPTNTPIPPTPVPPVSTTPTKVLITDFSWVEREVKILNGFTVTWHECPDQLPDSCVWWNTYKHSDGSFVPMEILRCKQDGAWVDESRKEHTGLGIGVYNMVSGITVRKCP